MSVSLKRRCFRTSALAVGAAIVVSSLSVSQAQAACKLPSGAEAGKCSYSGTGAALSITDTGGDPIAVEAVTTGTDGRALFGEASGANGVGGLFEIAGTKANSNNTAIFARNSGGAKTQSNYGNAGLFEITNAMNSSDAVYIDTNGFGNALNVVNSGGGDTEGHYGSAGIFQIGNSNNDSPAVSVYNYSQNQAAVGLSAFVGFVGSPGQGDAVLSESDGPDSNGVHGISAAGNGVQGETTNGYGVFANAQSGTAFFGTSETGAAANLYAGTNQCYFYKGTTWSCSSDRNLKEDFHAVDLRDMLHRLAAMPIFTYRLKQEHDPEMRWLGPVSQDFRAAFGLGENDDKHINLGNEMGVALAAVKGVYEELQDRDAMIAAQGTRIAALEERNNRLLADHDKIAAFEARLEKFEASEYLPSLAEADPSRRAEFGTH